jgi:hypothetical protein
MVTATRGYSNPSPQDDVPVNNTGSGYLVAAAASKIVRLYRMALTVSAATTVIFYDGDPGAGGVAKSGPFDLLANGSIVLDDSGNAWYTTSAGNGLYAALSNGSAVLAGTVWVIQV